MSLFPAYANNLDEKLTDTEVSEETVPYASESSVVSPRREAQLLASDNDEEAERAPAITSRLQECAPLDSNDFYVDRKFDCGNLRVSTLYYPGRPQYEVQRRAGGAERARRARRYFEAGALPDTQAPRELDERTLAWRRLLADQPHDHLLWLDFIDFQERHRGAAAALQAAQEAAARVGARAVRAALFRLLPAARRAEALRAALGAAAPGLRAELWLRLLGALAERGGAELDAAAAACVRALPHAYPHVLYACGARLRAAGLCERLVLLLELVTSMNFPPAAFPPPPDPPALERVERDLRDAEDEAVNSGLPLSTVWVRVERLRGAAHWRPAPPASLQAGADPQRAPLPADVAALVLPAQGAPAHFLLLAAALRLAKVPLLPCAEHVARAASGDGDAAGDARWAACGEAWLALLRAARRLPAAHPARAAPGAARRLVAQFAEPPHYLSDAAGYLRWLRALWDAACEWSAGAARAALLCWRLRWLHALLLLRPGDAEARRVRAEARLALRRWAGAEAAPFVQFARLEREAAGEEAARRTCLRAARAALAAREPLAALHAARVLAELGGAAPAAWLTASVALGADLPPDDRLERAPPAALLLDALRECEAQCERIEAELEAAGEDEAEEGSGSALAAAMLPGAGEWAAARARLAPGPRRRRLLAQLRAAAPRAAGLPARRYWEQAACALLQAAAAEHAVVPTARALLPLFPHSALLALGAAAAPASWGRGAPPAPPARTHMVALARLLPPLLRAVAADWAPPEAARVVAACQREASGGAGGALLAAVRLEAEARAPRPRPAHALLAALDELPQHKWLYVRGAAWCGAEAAALCDVLLERELRTHTLLEELVPAPTSDRRDPPQ